MQLALSKPQLVRRLIDQSGDFVFELGHARVSRSVVPVATSWGAARLLSYLIVGQIFDKYPNINAGVAEVGHGWLPHWVIRLGEMIRYVSGATPPMAASVSVRRDCRRRAQ